MRRKMLSQIIFLCLALAVVSGRQVTLDTGEDLSGSLWTVDCRYATNIADFWIIDCDLVGAEDSGRGFWTPCDATKCTITYNKNEAPSGDGLVPMNVSIRRKTTGGASISVTAGGEKATLPDGNWGIVSHDLPGSTTSRSSVIIELTAASTTNYSVIDMVEIEFGSGGNPTTTTTNSPTSTTTDGTCPSPPNECPPCNCNCNCGCPAQSAFI